MIYYQNTIDICRQRKDNYLSPRTKEVPNLNEHNTTYHVQWVFTVMCLSAFDSNIFVSSVSSSIKFEKTLKRSRIPVFHQRKCWRWLLSKYDRHLQAKAIWFIIEIWQSLVFHGSHRIIRWFSTVYVNTK